MIYLILCILFSSAIFIIFKYFEHFGISVFQAIVTNYIVAFFVGIASFEGSLNQLNLDTISWVPGALYLSILFIVVFNIMGLTSQQNGVSVASVASKMSIVIPILFGIYVYKETVVFIQWFGILLALLAVYLTASPSKQESNKGTLKFPLLLFLGSGIIDTSIKYIQNTFVPEYHLPLFSASIFGGAAVLGAIWLLISKTPINRKSIIGGIVLGIPNYYSIYFLLKALDSKFYASGVIFTMNNISIVVLTALLGFFIFKEKLTLKNSLGIAVAIISILLISQQAS